MCDIAYQIQLEGLEREVMAMRGQSAQADPKAKLPTVDEAQAEFDQWLAEAPAATTMTLEEIERAELRDLMLGRW